MVFAVKLIDFIQNNNSENQTKTYYFSTYVHAVTACSVKMRYPVSSRKVYFTAQNLNTTNTSQQECFSNKLIRTIEGNVLFNDALNTFYLRLYGVRHMVKDHSDSEKRNPLPHRLLFPINSKGSFICTIPQIGLHIAQPLLHQSWSTGWNEK